VPNQLSVGDADMLDVVPHAADRLDAFLQYLLGAEHRAVALHGLLHAQAKLRRRHRAVGIAEAVEPRDRVLARALRQLGDGATLLDELGAAMRGGAAESDQVDTPM